MRFKCFTTNNGCCCLYSRKNHYGAIRKNSYQLDTYPTKIIEGRYGVIQVYELGDKKHNVVYGANVYDGKTNTSSVSNTNGIDRPYVLAASKINAKKVLVIGLSTGFWV